MSTKEKELFFSKFVAVLLTTHSQGGGGLKALVDFPQKNIFCEASLQQQMGACTSSVSNSWLVYFGLTSFIRRFLYSLDILLIFFRYSIDIL